MSFINYINVTKGLMLALKIYIFFDFVSENLTNFNLFSLINFQIQAYIVNICTININCFLILSDTPHTCIYNDNYLTKIYTIK